MIEVEIPDKNVIVEFPDGMPEDEMINAINAEFYGAPSLRQDTPKPETFLDRAKPDTSLTEPANAAAAGIELEAMKAGMTPDAYKSKVYPEGHGLRRLEQLGNDFISGALGTGEGMLGAVQWVSESETAKELADVVSAHKDKLLADDPTYLDKLASGAGSAATFFLPGLGISKGQAAVQALGKTVASWTGLGLASTMEAMTEAGLSYRDTLQETGKAELAEDAADKTFWLNMVLLPVTNKLGVFGEKGKAVRKSLMSFLMEGSQESTQDVIKAVAEKKPVPDIGDLAETFSIGGIIGGGTSLATSMNQNEPIKAGIAPAVVPETPAQAPAPGVMPAAAPIPDAGMQPVAPIPAVKPGKPLGDTPVPTPQKVFDMVGVAPGNVYAHYDALHKKHPEYFDSPEAVKQHVEYVLENPDHALPATKKEYTLLVRRNGKDKSAVVEFTLKGGKYRVRSAYTMDDGQLEQKLKKQSGSSVPPTPARIPDREISSGSPIAPFDAIHPVEDNITTPEDKSNEKAQDDKSLANAIKSDAGFINLDLLVPKPVQKAVRDVADAVQNSRLGHHYNYLRGRQDSGIEVVLNKKTMPQLGHWFRNMDGILSQTHQGRAVYEAGRTFKQDTVKKFNEWKSVYDNAVQDLTDEQKLEVLNLLDSEEEISAQGRVGDAARTVRDLLTGARQYLIDNGHKVGYIEGYLPHVFQGKFWVKADDESSHKVETLGEALKIADEFAKSGKKNISVKQETFVPPDDATMLTRRSYWRLVKSLQEAVGQDVDVLEDLSASDIHEMLSENKVARPKPRKRFFGNQAKRMVNNPNFIKDLDRIMHLYFYGASRKVHQDIFAKDVQSNLDAMPAGDQRLKQFIENVYMPGVLAHPTNMEEAIAKVLHDLKIKPGATGQDVRKLMHNVNLVQYVMDLGLSVSSAVANASQFWMNAYPIVGEASAVRGYQKGIRTFGNPDLMKEIESSGVVESVSSVTGEVAHAKEILAEIKNKMLFKEGAKGFLEATMIPFSTVEVMNRFSTYWAGKDFAVKQLQKHHKPSQIARQVAPETSSLMTLAKDLEARYADQAAVRNAAWRKKTRSMEEEFARKFGYELNDKVNFRVGRENLPQILREVPIRLIAPYKSFLLNQLKYTAEAMGPKGIITNPKKALRFTAMTFALAGVAGNPVMWGVFQGIRYLYKQLFGIDLEKELRRRNMLRGVTGKLGLDISGSVAINLPTKLYDLLGRYGKIAVELGTLAHEKATGQGTIRTERKLTRQLMPAQMQRAVDAMTILETGEYVTPVSKTPVALDEPAWAAAIKRAAGILPADVAKAFEQEEEMLKLKEKYKSISADMTERWADAVKNGTPGQVDRVMRRFTAEVNKSLDKLNNARSDDETTEALTELMFWQSWASGDQKFKNALMRKILPRQIEQKRNLPKYLRPEAATQ